MKELSIEQKAQRYDEAISMAKKFYTPDSNNTNLKATLEMIFSELKEDERIRKELIEQVIYIVPDKNEVDDNGNTLPCYTTRKDRYIAWLEKQNSNVDNANKEYWRGYREGKQEILDKYAELEKQGEQKPVISNDALREGIAHFGITQYQIDNWLKKYVDVEKQGEQKTADKAESNLLTVERAKEMSPFMRSGFENEYAAWSEEDEKILDLIIARLHSHPNVEAEEYGKDYHWLKSLKDRYIWRPSDEQMEALDSATENCAYSEYQDCLRELIGQLKKLREE